MSLGLMSQAVFATAFEDLPEAKRSLALAIEAPAQQRNEWSMRIRRALELFESNDKGGKSYRDVAIGVLSGFLDNPDMELRLRAVWGLVQFKDDGKLVAPPLALALFDPAPEVQLEAVMGLLYVGPGADAAIPALIESLNSDNLTLRVRAAGALGHIGQSTNSDGPILSALEPLLKSEKYFDRLVAIRNLSLIGTLPSATAKFSALLSDPEPRVRAAALRALGKIGPDALAASPDIFARVKDQDASVRAAAHSALVNLGQLNEPVIETLQSALQDDEWTVRISAVRLLIFIDIEEAEDSVLPVLVAALWQNDPSIQNRALRYLKLYGRRASKAVFALITILRSDDFFLVREAAIVLRTIGVPANPAIPDLVNVALQNPRNRNPILFSMSRLGTPEYAREEAAQTLVKFSKNGASVIDLIVPRLSSLDVVVRGNAADLLRRIGIPDAAAVPLLRNMAANDKDFSVRIDAVRALGAMGSEAKVAVPLLIATMEDESYMRPTRLRDWIRRWATIALGNIGAAAESAIPALSVQLADGPLGFDAARALLKIGDPRDMLPLLLQLRRQDKDHVPAFAIQAIGMLGPGAEPVVPDLIRLLLNPSENVRIAAVGTLGQVGPAAAPAVQPLLRIPAEESKKLRIAIVNALGLIGDRSQEVLSKILAALDDDDHMVAFGAADALARIGPTADAIPGLIRLLEEDDRSLGASAAKALGLLGPAANDAVPVLISHLESGNSLLKDNAAAALGEIGPAASAAIPKLEELIKFQRQYRSAKWQYRRDLYEKSLRQIRDE